MPGAEWLKRSSPAGSAFAAIPQAASSPDAADLVKAAREDGYFSRPAPGFEPLTDGPVTTEYRIVPDRDLNGAGLLYFANYPMILDICEREALSPLIPEDMLDRRTIVRRRSAYLNNAASHDTLVVETEAWLKRGPETRLFVNARMSRRSDGRLMIVSTAEKAITPA